MNYNIIIIGSGLAGLNSALHASKFGSVLVVTKSKLMDSNSRYAQGGVAGVFLPEDNFKKHIADTLTAGANHNNPRAVKYFVEQSPKTMKVLQKLGVRFETDAAGTFDLHREAGHQHKRIVHVGDHTGLSIMEVLVQKVLGNKNITVWQNSFVKDLIIEGKTCEGALVIHKNRYVPVYARRVILASGGVGQLYEHTTNPVVTTGDGIAIAARAGCTIKDMEFIQFHPTAFGEKKDSKKTRSSKDNGEFTTQPPLFLISETVRGNGAKLLNAKGERFMPKYHKLAELAPRDIVSRAIFHEQKHGQVFLDIRTQSSGKSSKELRKDFPSISAELKKYGYDLSKDLIPVTPAAHHLSGGVVTDVYGKTNIKNLYAIGEAACTGLHGANRLASNSLLEAAVMSEHVVENMNQKTSLSFTNQNLIQNKSVKVEQKINTASAKETKKLSELRQKLQQTMWRSAGIIRTEKLLETGRRQLVAIKKQLPSTESIQKFELRNMIEVGLLILQAALRRKKSLGSHFRNN